MKRLWGVVFLVAVTATSVTEAAAQIGFETGTLEGTVLTTGGAPVAGAQVRVTSDAGGAETWTDAAGAYQLTNMPVGDYQLEVFFDHDWAMGTDAASVTAGTTTVVDFTVSLGEVRGSITRDGLPDQGARMQLRRTPPNSCAEADSCLWQETDPDTGDEHCHCELGGLDFFCDPWNGCHWMHHAELTTEADAGGNASRLVPPGDYDVSFFPGWQEAASVEIAVGTESVAVVDQGVHLLAPVDYQTGSVAGLVTVDGVPLSWGEIQIRSLDLSGGGSAWIDFDGSYSVILPVGSYELSVWDHQPPHQALMTQTVVVTQGATVPADFAITTSGGLSGTVVANATVDGAPDANARLSLELVAPSSCSEATSCYWIDTEPETGDEHCHCEQDGYDFFCDPWGGCHWMEFRGSDGQADATGRIELQVEPGSYHATVYSSLWSEGAGAWAWSDTTVYSGVIAVAQDETVDLGALGYLTGTVSGSLTNCGTPGDGYRVELRGSGSNANVEIHSGDGSYSVRVRDGDYTAIASWQHNEIATAPVTVTAGFDASFSAESQNGLLRGTILRDGQPATNAQVTLQRPPPASCDVADSCLWREPDPDTGEEHCHCEVGGLEFFCDPWNGCHWMHDPGISGNTGSDGIFTVQAPPGLYDVLAFAQVGQDGPEPMPGGGSFLIGTVPAAVFACQLTEIGASAATVDPGTSVPADLGNGVSLTFDNVTDTGQVSYVATSTPQEEPEPTATIEFVGLYYDIIVEATFTDQVELCLPYDAEEIEVAPETLKIYHYETGIGWVDITTSVDTVNQVVCGLTSSFSWFVVAQVLNSPPVADAGGDRELEVGDDCVAIVPLDGAASADPDGDPLTYQWQVDGASAGSGAAVEVALEPGTYVATLTVTDAGGASHSDQVELRVVDLTAPALTVSLSQDLLWPPNNKMVEIVPTIDATDNCDLTPTVSIASLTSDTAEPGDMSVDGALGTFWVRAARRGSERNGRVYTVEVEAIDSAGNATVETAEVIVPHDMR